MGAVLTRLRKQKYIDGGAVKELRTAPGEPESPPQGPYIRDSWGQLVRLPKDYNVSLVKKLIRARRLAPFYEGSADEGSIDLAIKAFTKHKAKKSDCEAVYFDSNWLKEELVECPICLLDFPRNLNYTTCCRQPLCTACFVKIKRPNSGRVISCPFCVYANFSVVYHKPRWIKELERSESERDDALKPDPVAAEAIKILSAHEQRLAYQAFQQRLYQQYHQRQSQQQSQSQSQNQQLQPPLGANQRRYVFYEPGGMYTFYDNMYYRTPSYYHQQQQMQAARGGEAAERAQLAEAIRRSLLESA
jgi:hypothetical protein